mgnify:CR=1 FL=1
MPPFVQKQTQSQPAKQQAEPVRKRTIPHRDLGELEGKILQVVSDNPKGITLKEIATKLDIQWHYLRIPLRQMTLENKLVKEEKLYMVHVTPNEAPKQEEIVVPDPPQPETVTPEPSVPEKVEEPVEETRPSAPRRRVIDARELEKRSAKQPAIPNLSVRDRERLRYRILTALRGRPEGLTLDKLSAVLGMELKMLIPILEELHGENKVVSDNNGKYILP